MKKGGQELVGGLDVKVIRNRYGTQIQSFVADLQLPFLGEGEGEGEKPFRGVFIRAPVVEAVNISPSKNAGAEGTGKNVPVEVLGVYQRKPKQDAAEGGDGQADEDIVAVRQRNIFGTSFHPELTSDIRIHVWWLRQVLDAVKPQLN